jgi:hypothetical protein
MALAVSNSLGRRIAATPSPTAPRRSAQRRLAAWPPPGNSRHAVSARSGIVVRGHRVASGRQWRSRAFRRHDRAAAPLLPRTVPDFTLISAGEPHRGTINLAFPAPRWSSARPSMCSATCRGRRRSPLRPSSCRHAGWSMPGRDHPAFLYIPDPRPSPIIRRTDRRRAAGALHSGPGYGAEVELHYAARDRDRAAAQRRRLALTA